MVQRLAFRPHRGLVRAALTIACGLAALAIGLPGSGVRAAPKRALAGRLDASGWTPVALEGLRPEVFSRAVQAVSCAVRSGDVDVPSVLTVIDYSLPSTSRRLWVFDLDAHDVLFRELVAHGQGSGGNLASRFSNEADSHASSLGLFVTRETYDGKNGYSLRLEGLERGFNDHALARAIVMHGASYVSDSAATALGRLGRSWGCPAVREGIVRELIDRVKGGSLVFAYYPDEGWLKTSRYLGDCAAATRD